MKRSWSAILIAALGCGLGLVLVFYPIFVSGFRLTHGGLGDARLVNYTLEHGYRWVTQMPGHESFWDPPIFYPYRNVSAFTEVQLGVGPFYWVWRLMGLAPDTSFQLWMLTVWALNFLAAYLLFRRGFGFRPVASAAGAFFLAFGTTLQAHFTHPQLIPLFYVLLAFLALLRLFDDSGPEGEEDRKGWWGGLFFVCVVLQAYTCFYTFFFFGLLLAIAVLWSLALPGPRSRLVQVSRYRNWPTLVAAVGGTLVLGYLASRYLVTAEQIGVRIFEPEKLPSWLSWLRVHERNVLWGWLSLLTSSRMPTAGSGWNGPSLIVLGLSIFGLIHYRRHTVVRLLLLSGATVIVMTTSWGGFSLWESLRGLIPGAAALRAVFRFGIVLALLAGVGVALGVERLLQRRRYALIAILMILGVVELIHNHAWADKVLLRDRIAELAAMVDRESEAFFMVSAGPGPQPDIAELAEWVGLETGVPTVNGRYGNYPPGWDLRGAERIAVVTEGQRRELQENLRSWCDATGLDCAQVQWIEIESKRIPRIRFMEPTRRRWKRWRQTAATPNP